MNKVSVLCYGVFSYLLFALCSMYLFGFLTGVGVSKSIDHGTSVGVSHPLIWNLALILLFGIQHSLMARDSIKSIFERVIPQYLERSTYVLVSSVVLGLMMLLWEPMPKILWVVSPYIMWPLFALGALLATGATFFINHFDLFGLRQVWMHIKNKPYSEVPFTERFIYCWIRHPMMLGLLICFWATPQMSEGHLIFSLGMSLYVTIGIYFEEKTTAEHLGQDYVNYRDRTARLIPKIY